MNFTVFRIILFSFFIFISPPSNPGPDTISNALNMPTPVPTATPAPQPALYSAFTAKELDLLFRVVECEARGGSLNAKANVASVIFNRVRTGWSGGNLTAILMSPRQFEVVTLGLYKTAKVTKSTIRACEMAFEKDTVDGAVYFDSTNGKSWAAEECRKGNLIWVMRDDINHDFYRKKRKGE